MLFAAMEEEVRKHIEDSQEGCRDILFTVISSNNEVLFHWCLLTAEMIQKSAAQTTLP